MLLKLSKWCEILSFKLRQKSLYFELKHYIKNNRSYFRKIRHWERNMGNIRKDETRKYEIVLLYTT